MLDREVRLVYVLDKKQFLIVDADSGEIVRTMQQGDKIIPQHIGERLMENIGYENEYINLRRRYVKYFEGIAQEIAKLKFTATDILVMLYLAEHTRTGSGAILHNNNQPITKENIVKIFSLSSKTIDTVFRRLEDSGIIAVCITEKKKKYFFNPYILMRGRYVNKTLYQMFNKTYWYKFGKPNE